jgi:hypothetical protein
LQQKVFCFALTSKPTLESKETPDKIIKISDFRGLFLIFITQHIIIFVFVVVGGGGVYWPGAFRLVHILHMGLQSEAKLV